MTIEDIGVDGGRPIVPIECRIVCKRDDKLNVPRHTGSSPASAPAIADLSTTGAEGVAEGGGDNTLDESEMIERALALLLEDTGIEEENVFSDLNEMDDRRVLKRNLSKAMLS